MWILRHLVLIVLAIVGHQLIYHQSAGQPQRKFAPAYCLRFKFNCARPEKKGHVCCLYPLPENAQQAQQQASPGAGLNIRPIRLPISKNPASSENENEENRNKPASNKSTNKKNSRPNNRNNSRNTPKPNQGIKNRPRICQRLVVNCKSSPEHRCCLYQQNEGK